MKFTSWNGEKTYKLNACPFCGGEPRVRHIGNDRSQPRKVVVWCTKCRVKRVDSGMRHGFSWLEDIAVRNWNQSPEKGE